MFDGRGDGVPVASISTSTPRGRFAVHPQLREEAESLMRVLELRFTDEDLAKAKEHVDMQTTRRPRGKPSPRRDALLPRMRAGWLREAL